LLNYRIAMARDFLAEPSASISQVAYAVGFNDLSHFGRMFRRLVGEPATRYHQRVSPPTGSGRGESTRAENSHLGADRS
ncbi:MAG: helix-turn-helix domain-containing protein, partial [Rhodanobacteraceae bacterium]